MTRIILTGSSGYLGSHLCRFFEEEKVFALYYNNKPQSDKVEPIQIDLSNDGELNFLFKEIKPDYVIHLAAVIPSNISVVDDKLIFQINVEVTKQIASLAQSYNSFLIFTSTDLIYDDGDNIKENHPLNPLNLYAQSKLQAENAILRYGKYFLILRTSLMYGFSISPHKSFFDLSFIQLKNNQEVRAFYDQFRNPLFVEDAARFIIELMKIKLSDEDVMNFCGFEKLSRFEMVMKTAEIFDMNKNLILKESCEILTNYKTAKNLGLNFDKMKKLNLIPNSYEQNLLHLKKNFDFYEPFLINNQNKVFKK